MAHKRDKYVAYVNSNIRIVQVEKCLSFIKMYNYK